MREYNKLWSVSSLMGVGTGAVHIGETGGKHKMENRKVFLNKHTNLLELEEHMYPLVDVDTPNVFRNPGRI